MKKIRKKIISIFLTACMLFSLMPQLSLTAAATSWLDDGTTDTSWYTGHESDSSYSITTPEALAGFASLVNGGNSFSGKTVELGTNIVLNDVSGVSSWSTNAPSNLWTPIGGGSSAFKGTFDGCGHTVSGIYINTANNYQGLFGYINGGKIKNVGVIASYIKGGAYDGGLVGYIASGSITNSYNTGSVTGGSSGSSYIGGLAGQSVSTKITSCYNTGSISTSGSNIGGLVGRSGSSTITKCYNKGSITKLAQDSQYYVGGLVGYSYNSSAITNCYNMGSVSSADDYVGGLVGYNYGRFPGFSDGISAITNCYNMGSVNSNYGDVGGIAGRNDGTVTGCYYDSQTSVAEVGIGYGDATGAETTAWMKNATAATTGWDAAVWSFVSNAYPQLIVVPYVLNVSPDGAEAATSGSLVITFSKTMNTAAGGTVSLSGGSTPTGLSAGSWSEGNTVYTVAYSGLAYETKYTVAISGFTDAEGKPMTDDSDHGFTTKPIPGIQLSQTGPYTFAEETVGYSSITPLSVTVTNADNKATGNLTVALDDKGAGSFTLSSDTISGIASGGTGSFTVVPKTGLSAGTHTATVTVSGDNVTSRSFTVCFTVNARIWNSTLDTNWYTGHENDSSYIITTPEELAGFASLVNGGNSFSDKTVELGTNIVLNDVSGVSSWSTTAPSNSWTPIGGSGNTFKGTFDGCGYTVSGIYINTTNDDQGLFGNINGGKIKNIGVIDSYIKGGAYDGGLVGYIESGTITNCYNTGSVTGGSKGSSYIGGLAGQSVSTAITSCHNTGSISTKGSFIGGLVGRSDSSTISKCYNTGSIAGCNYDSDNVGGLVGGSYSSAITNCYNTGSVSGLVYSNNIGGLVGDNRYTITHCYNAGSVTRRAGSNYTNAGGIVGSNRGTVTSCYYDSQTGAASGGINGSDAAGAAVGKTTAWLKNATATAGISGDTETFAGWDSVVWSFSSNAYPQLNTAPYVLSVSPDGADGAASGSLVITFSETMDTAGENTVSLSDGSTSTGLSAGSWSADNTVYTVAYSGLKYKTEYTVTISGFTDTEGKTMTDDSNHSFTTDATPGIRLSQTEPYTFAEETVGYSAVTPLSVTVTNADNQATGDLTVSLNDTDAGSFTLSSDTISSIASGGTGSFTVVPKTGLSAGTHSATVSVSGDNVSSKSFTVRFTVNTGIWSGTTDTSWYSADKSNFTITTPEELAGFASLVNGGNNFSGKTVTLSTNIFLNDVSGVSSWSTNAPSNSWKPIGGKSSAFKGTFVGYGHTVSGIYISTTADYQGLFGNTNGGKIKNVGVIDSYIKGGAYDGGLVGYIESSTITNCYNTGSVTGGSRGSSFIGGLAGRSVSTTITNCHNTGSISTSGGIIGGLVGRSDSSTISKCYNRGSITGLVYGSDNVGGLVGGSYGISAITNCYNMGSVSGLVHSNNAGGLVGDNRCTITNCYNTGSVTGCINPDNMNVGGIAGISSGTVTGCYYDSQTSCSGGINGGDTAGAAVGKTTVWMKNANATSGINGDADTFAGWDTAVWSFVSNEYPQLYGIGLSQTDPYTFTAKTAGYSSVSPLSVTVSNAGNQATGDLTVALTGDNAANFTLSKTAVSSIAEGDTDTFTLAPNTGLTAGTYTATVTVSGKSVTSQTFTVSFTVNPKSSAKTITGFTLGGVSGTIKEDDHTIAVTLPYGTNITSLTPTITVSANATVSPASGTARDFTAPVTYTVTAENGTTQDYTVTVTVNPINTYSISLNQTTPYTFTSQTVGYSSVTPLSITVSNTGNQATGDLTIALTGTGKDSFTLSKTTISSIVASGSDTFTVNPNDSLAAGTYTSTVTVSGGNSISKSFTVSFTVSSGSSGGNSGSSGGSSSSSNSNIIVTTENNITSASQTFTASTGSNGVATASVTKDQIAGMIKAASEKAQEQNTQKALEIKVDSGTSATGVSVTIPQAAASSLKDGVNSLTLASPTVTVTFDEKALAEIGKNTNGDITVKAIKLANTTLSDEDKAVIGTRPVYDLRITSGSTTVSSFGGGTATVSVPYTPAAGENVNAIVVYYINASGELVTVPNCVYDAKKGTVTFTTTHFSTYAIGYNAVSFSDVSGSNWYADYVAYLAARGIIGGNNGAFSPDANITRAEFVTILARMSGESLSGYTNSSFSDVSADSWYLAAVQWANKAGIASGYDGKFSPSATITREQMAAMLYRYAKYKGTVSNSEGMSVREFTDYDSISSWALAPIQWAMNNKILSGNTDGSFSPQSSATRAQAAKMLAVLMQGMVK